MECSPGQSAFALWGSTIGAAAALGPLLGGRLAEHISWRWAFGINVPLSVLVGAGVLRYIAPSPRTRGRIDVPGSLLSVAGLACSPSGWSKAVRTAGSSPYPPRVLTRASPGESAAVPAA